MSNRYERVTRTPVTTPSTVHSFRVSQRESRQSLATILQSRLRLPYARALILLRNRQVILDGAVCRNPMVRPGRGQRVAIQDSVAVKRGGSSAPRRQRDGGQQKSARRALAGPRPQVVFMDADVIVVDKPPGITTMRHSSEAAEFGARARRYLPATLADWLEEMMASTENPRKKSIRAVHRVDKDTSGLVVFARTPLAQRELSKQFRAHVVERRYLAIVRGKAKSQRISSYLVDDRGDGRRGARQNQAPENMQSLTCASLRTSATTPWSNAGWKRGERIRYVSTWGRPERPSAASASTIDPRTAARFRIKAA